MKVPVGAVLSRGRGEAGQASVALCRGRTGLQGRVSCNGVPDGGVYLQGTVTLCTWRPADHHLPSEPKCSFGEKFMKSTDI